MLRIVLNSKNKKLSKSGEVAATYREVGPSCPPSCPMNPFNPENTGEKKSTCYATRAHVGLAQRGMTPEVDDAAVLLACKDQIPSGWFFRHGVAGGFHRDGKPDYPYITAVKELAEARPDVIFWGYEHGWREIDPTLLESPYGNLTINASVHSIEEAQEARQLGWKGIAMVVPPAWPKTLKTEGQIFQVCPHDSSGGKVTCVECGLCMKADRKAVICFPEKHIPKARKEKEVQHALV